MTLRTTKVLMIVLFTCLLAALCLPAVAATVTVTTYDNDGGALSASGDGADTTTVSDKGTDAFGAEDQVWSKSRPTVPEFELVFLRFDLSQVLGLNTLTGARLQLYDYRLDGSFDGTVWDVGGLYDSEDLWNEATMTWDNAPAAYDMSPSFTGSATDWGAFTVDAVTNTPWSQEITDMSSDLISLIDADTNNLVTVLTYHVTTNSKAFGSKETTPVGTAAPRLILEGPDVGFIPEPSTFVMLGIGGLLLLIYRWRRRR